MIKTRKIGAKYEYYAEMFLVKQDFVVLYKNFYTRYGEIDLICEKNGEIYFFEVKSVSCKTLCAGITGLEHVTREKISRLTSSINIFCREHSVSNSFCHLQIIEVINCICKYYSHGGAECFLKTNETKCVCNIYNCL